jgi:hypothetical protein
MDNEAPKFPKNEIIPHLPPDSTASNLSMEEVTGLLEQCSGRKEKFLMLTLLYARKLDIRKVLSKEYRYTPEKFSSILIESASGLLAQLPEEYSLLPRLICSGNRILINIDIVPPEAEKEYFALADRTMPYDEYINQVGKSEPTPGAGYATFTISRQKIYGVIFDFVYGNHMQVSSINIASRPDIRKPSLKSVHNKNKIRSPLLVREGGKFSVSDEFIKMQESLIEFIAEDSESVGIACSSFLTEDGKRMRLRNGYTQDYLRSIPESYRKAFETTGEFNFLKGESDSVLKIIHLPKRNIKEIKK